MPKPPASPFPHVFNADLAVPVSPCKGAERPNAVSKAVAKPPRLLLVVVGDRYAKKSVMIASQLPIAKWHEYGEPTLADAIMNRLFANAHRFELKGESLRKKSPKKSPEKQ